MKTLACAKPEQLRTLKGFDETAHFKMPVYNALTPQSNRNRKVYLACNKIFTELLSR